MNTFTLKTVLCSKHKEKEETKRPYARFVKMMKERSYGQEIGEAFDLKIEEDEWLESKGQQKLKRLYHKGIGFIQTSDCLKVRKNEEGVFLIFPCSHKKNIEKNGESVKF